MNLLDRLERKLRPFAVVNVTLYIIALQVVAYVLILALGPKDAENVERMFLLPAKVLQGEVWRLVTFLFLPPASNPIFLFFALSMFYTMGTALEVQWGTVRYNIYLLVGWLVTVAAAFCNRNHYAANWSIGGSVFLAFAFLYPDYEIRLFFLLPVKMKWLAMLTWLGYAWAMVVGGAEHRLMVAASTFNFFLFFSVDVYRKIRYHSKTGVQGAVKAVSDEKPFHECQVCHVSDLTDRKMEFRYCPDCAGSPCYCINHINAHEHKTA